VIDVIVQFGRDERGRFISEIAYEPRRRRFTTDDKHFGNATDAQAGLFDGAPT